ncbi:ethylene-responsive transcription factor RAP2-4-like [Telopea speciosissima]|uniref:ethylene-responsive transcription factor RAP2-4-like n=1 Tax=Telopea speciosissima TaxID=54955 RepID=UPI001CC58A38|nr:ethylene-responsive transcription factor RAP2-4-like [Telopea speciosissima]
MGCRDPTTEEPYSALAQHVRHSWEVALAYNKAAYKLQGEFARLNFPNLRHQINVGGEFSDYEPLYSSVDALQAICQGLSTSQKEEKLGKPAFYSEKKANGGQSHSQARSPVGNVEFLETKDCKVESAPSYCSLG